MLATHSRQADAHVAVVLSVEAIGEISVRQDVAPSLVDGADAAQGGIL